MMTQFFLAHFVINCHFVKCTMRLILEAPNGLQYPKKNAKVRTVFYMFNIIYLLRATRIK